jgi:hypothetical protein
VRQKPGPRPLPEGKARTAVLHVRVRPSDLALLERAAKALGVDFATYVRGRLLVGSPEDWTLREAVALDLEGARREARAMQGGAS